MTTERDPAYIALRDICAERISRIVAFVGSGLSVEAGLPTWRQLRERLCDTASAKIESLDSGDKLSLFRQRDSAKVEDNLWKAFGILKAVLGNTTYRGTVRRELDTSHVRDVPKIYLKLWDLNVAGVLNLNLDRLATKAFSQRTRAAELYEFTGSRAKWYAHLINTPRPFIAYLHGILEEEDSWVLTIEELARLRRDGGYRRFIETCFLTHTVLFIGISADDAAVGGYLHDLVNSGIAAGEHFWITDRRDAATDSWAESANVRVIRYKNGDGQHNELRQIIDNLISYLPKERPVQPVAPVVAPSPTMTLPSPDDLELEDPDTIRRLLNAEAARILALPESQKYDEYQEFMRRYDACIHRAWYVTTDAPRNRLLKYTLLKEVGGGAFGTIYRASDDSGVDKAVKLLHQDLRRDQERFQSFRRGVSAMRILSEKNVTGVVPYIDACEIPTFAVMEFIEGESLLNAVQNQALREWRSIMWVAWELTDIIRRSHQLPEHVLHRDIRPSNVMLKNYWLGEEDWQVVVLDFDLSWHRESYELSISAPGVMNGFLAPELAYRDSNAPTRSALVDSYGLGMTLYYMRTGEQPIFAQSRHANWETTLRNHANRFQCRQWRSLPHRFFRTIFTATKMAQRERCDVSEILAELAQLKLALDFPETVQSLELWAEELAARSGAAYEWDADKCLASIGIGGLAINIIAHEVERAVELSVSWVQQGRENYQDVRRWLERACPKVNAALRDAGWREPGISVGSYQFEGSAHADIRELQQQTDRLVGGVRSAIELAQFK